VRFLHLNVVHGALPMDLRQERHIRNQRIALFVLAVVLVSLALPAILSLI
jgi:hypothetical protein